MKYFFLIRLGCIAILFSSFYSETYPGEFKSNSEIENDTLDYPFSFIDVGNIRGLIPDASEIRGHGAAWGDVNGDGLIDLFVGTFQSSTSKPGMLFINNGNRFVQSTQQTLGISARSTGAIFADFDNDGDLDLYVGNMPMAKKGLVASSLFENLGDGTFHNISENNGACPVDFGARSAAVLDYDGDGLLDLLVGEDQFPGYNGSLTHSFRLFKNLGNLKFKDITSEAEIRRGIPGYGVAAADVNNDGWPDFFVASAEGGNVLFVNNKDGTFTEVEELNDLFYWPDSGGDKMVCGISFGDLNGDGLLDIVLGPHFLWPHINPQPVRLFLNMGNNSKEIPDFKEITEEAGLPPIYMKMPHIEIQDMDNDGLPDITTSAIRFNNGIPYPVIFKNMGLNNAGIPVFKDYNVNDYPDLKDSVLSQTDFWDKTLREGKMIYGAPGPTGDFNNDGKLDMLIVSWWLEKPSLLLQNETKGGNWIQVTVEGKKGVNKMGVGSRINIYKNGKLGEASALIGTQDISVGYGYASGQQAMAHFGLGAYSSVDIEVILPHKRGTIKKRNINVNQRINL